MPESAPHPPHISSLAEIDEYWMRLALVEASAAGSRGEVPVAALVVQGGKQVAIASNRTVRDADPSAHAEMLVIKAAVAETKQPRLTDCTIYITLEPCAMCAGAIVLTRLKRVVFGAWDDKAGMAGSVGDLLRHPVLNHQPEVAAGVLAHDCGAVLSAFFASRRAK